MVSSTFEKLCFHRRDTAKNNVVIFAVECDASEATEILEQRIIHCTVYQQAECARSFIYGKYKTVKTYGMHITRKDI